MTLHETPLAEKQVIEKRIHVATGHTVTIPPYHIDVIPLKPVNHTCNIDLKSNTLLEIEENPFLPVEQPKITIIPTLQKLEGRTPDAFQAVIWNPGGHNITLKRNTTINYVKESSHIEKSQIDQEANIGEITEISQENLTYMPDKICINISS